MVALIRMIINDKKMIFIPCNLNLSNHFFKDSNLGIKDFSYETRQSFLHTNKFMRTSSKLLSRLNTTVITRRLSFKNKIRRNTGSIFITHLLIPSNHFVVPTPTSCFRIRGGEETPSNSSISSLRRWRRLCRGPQTLPAADTGALLLLLLQMEG